MARERAGPAPRGDHYGRQRPVGRAAWAVAPTSRTSAPTRQIAFNYAARAEIAKAARRLAERVLEGTIGPHDVTPEALSAALDTYGVPDPDLLIRTSGEQRLSNFLLWQSA